MMDNFMSTVKMSTQIMCMYSYGYSNKSIPNKT